MHFTSQLSHVDKDFSESPESVRQLLKRTERKEGAFRHIGSYRVLHTLN